MQPYQESTFVSMCQNMCAFNYNVQITHVLWYPCVCIINFLSSALQKTDTEALSCAAWDVTREKG